MRDSIRRKVSKKQHWFTLDFSDEADKPKYLSSEVQSIALEKFSSGKFKCFKKPDNRNEVKTIFISRRLVNFSKIYSSSFRTFEIQNSIDFDNIDLFRLKCILRLMYLYSLTQKKEVNFLLGSIENLLLANCALLEFISDVTKGSDRIYSLPMVRVNLHVDDLGLDLELELVKILQVLVDLKNRGPLYQITDVCLFLEIDSGFKVERVISILISQKGYLMDYGLHLTFELSEAHQAEKAKNRESNSLKVLFVTRHVSIKTLERCLIDQPDLVLASIETPLKLRHWLVYS